MQACVRIAQGPRTRREALDRMLKTRPVSLLALSLLRLPDSNFPENPYGPGNFTPYH